MHRIGGKGRGDAWRDAAMPPCDYLAVLVEASLDAFHGHRVKEAVTNVIVPRPLHLHRRAELFRKQGGFEGVIALRLASESAAEQRDVDSHVLLGNADRLGDVFARSARTLH